MAPMEEHRLFAHELIAMWVDQLRGTRDISQDVARLHALADRIIDVEGDRWAAITVAQAGALLVRDLCKELGLDPTAYMRETIEFLATDD